MATDKVQLSGAVPLLSVKDDDEKEADGRQCLGGSSFRLSRAAPLLPWDVMSDAECYLLFPRMTQALHMGLFVVMLKSVGLFLE